jgi:hypothetical protein
MAKRAARWIHDRIFLPIDVPTDFQEPEEVLIKRLQSTDAGMPAEILRQARDYFEETFARARSVEQRVTTLLSAAGISASFSLAGGTFLLSREETSVFWQFVFSAAYALVLVSLFGTSLRALQTLSIQRWTEPDTRELLEPLATDVAEAQLREAAQLLISGGRNQPVARWKVAQANAAAWWFTRTIWALLALVVCVVLFALVGPAGSTQGGPTPSPSPTAAGYDGQPRG